MKTGTVDIHDAENWVANKAQIRGATMAPIIGGMKMG